ncbi:hypothetical protein DAI22_04g271000 [Oryza sativa Japonica Group]|nr:hypothetical protein DAI22_04g271000 [Oryza sativa Japonica Group]
MMGDRSRSRGAACSSFSGWLILQQIGCCACMQMHVVLHGEEDGVGSWFLLHGRQRQIELQVLRTGSLIVQLQPPFQKPVNAPVS